MQKSHNEFISMQGNTDKFLLCQHVWISKSFCGFIPKNGRVPTIISLIIIYTISCLGSHMIRHFHRCWLRQVFIYSISIDLVAGVFVCVSPGTCVCVVRCAGLRQTHRDVSRKKQNEHMPLSLQARGPGASLERARGWPWLPRGTDQGGLLESLDIGGRWGLEVREPNEPPRSLSPGLPSCPTSRISGRSRKINSAPLWSSLLPCFSSSTRPFSADLINHACNTHTHHIFSLSFCLSFLHFFFSRQNAFQTKHDASHKG